MIFLAVVHSVLSQWPSGNWLHWWTGTCICIDFWCSVFSQHSNCCNFAL